MVYWNKRKMYENKCPDVGINRWFTFKMLFNINFLGCHYMNTVKIIFKLHMCKCRHKYADTTCFIILETLFSIINL